MSKVSVSDVQAAVRRARAEVAAAGVSPDEADVVAAALAALELSGVSSAPPSAEVRGTVAPGSLPETFAEWAAHFQLDNHYDRFLVAGVYLLEKQEAPVVTTDDIIQMYRKARWERPGNPADVIGKAAKHLYFAEADDFGDGEGGKRRWRVTNTGYTHFQSLRKEQSNGH